MEDQEKDARIQVGFDIQDFTRTQSGTYFLQALSQQVSVTLLEMGLGKIQSGDDKGAFKCQTLAEFERMRGTVLGIQWVIDFIKARISEAKRLQKEIQGKSERDPSKSQK